LKLEDTIPLENDELSSYSWTIKNKNTAFKILDKSAFLYRGTGILIENRRFFLDSPLKAGDRKTVTLTYEGKEYEGHIEMDHQPIPRTRLFWSSGFAKELTAIFPNHFEQYKDGKDVVGSDIVMKFERVGGFNNYKVTFPREIKQESLEQ